MAPASRVAPIDKLSVALVVVLAVVVLGEPLTWKVAVGV
jgi:bacterial/archaeal transporter family protein